MASITSVKDLFQGLPGLGVNMGSGNKGIKGRSIYIGHIKDFFDYKTLTEKERLYIRRKLKNEDAWDDVEYWKRIKEDIDKYLEFTMIPVNYATESDIRVNILDREKHQTAEVFRSLPFSKEAKYKYYKDETDGSTQEKNENNTNVTINYASDIMFPTNLRETFKVGDLIYIIDDKTNKISYYFTVTKALVGCSYNFFTDQVFNSIPAMTSSFTLEDFICKLYNNLVLSKVSLNDVFYQKFRDEKGNIRLTSEAIEYINDFSRNFIKHHYKEYPLCILSNEDKEWVGMNNIVLLNSITNTKHHTIKYIPSNEGTFVIKSNTKLKMNSMFIKNLWTNINVPEYNNSSLKLEDGLHLYNIKPIDIENLGTKEKIELAINIKPDNYIKMQEENSWYGFKVINPESHKCIYSDRFNDNTVHILKLSDIVGDSSFDKLYLYSFAQGMNTMEYSSRLSQISFEYDSKGNIKNYSYSENDIEDLNQDSLINNYNNNTILYEESNYIDFKADVITCEATTQIPDSMKKVIITPKQGVIKDVYINNECFVKEGIINNKANVDSWLHIKQNEGFINYYSFKNNVFTCSFYVDSNIPTVDVSDENGKLISQTSDFLYEYFDKLSDSKNNYEIGDNIVGTSDREIVISVISEYNSKYYKSLYKITQPGISNILPSIKVSFENLIKNNKIEESNKPENGILCNQFQYFTNMSISGFNKDTYGKYLKDPKVSVYLVLDKRIDRQDNNTKFRAYSNIENIHIYSMNDVSAFSNNAVKCNFGYILPDSSVSYNSPLIDIDNAETGHYFKYTARTGSFGLDGYDTDWWFNINKDTIPYTVDIAIPSDIKYILDKDSSIPNISFDNAGKNIMLRTQVEFADPIPAELNFKWAVSRIEVTGEINYDDTGYQKDNSKESHMFTFFKDFNVDGQIFNTNDYYSDLMQFIINPIYLTAAHYKDEENLSAIKGSIKKTGSEQNVCLRTGIYDLDDNIKKVYNTPINENPNSTYNNSIYQFMKKLHAIKNYYPKKEYFQDNIKNIKISPKDLKAEYASGISPLSSEYINFYKYINENKSNYESLKSIMSDFNQLPIDFTSNSSNKQSNRYLAITYKSGIMYPQNRAEGNTFYYNNELYDASLYDQYNSKSPILVDSSIVKEIIDASLLLAKQTWNYEYEVSDSYNQSYVFGGSLTKSGNGYMFAKADLDEGQYNENNIYSLTDTQDKASQYIEYDSSIPISLSTDINNIPEKNKLFRTLVWDINWIYPEITQINGNYKVYPNYFANSYESALDSYIYLSYMKDTTENNEESDLYNYIKNTDKIKKLFNDNNSTDNIDAFLNKKFIYSVSSETGKSLQAKQLIPYNLLYDIYPRTAYNTDDAVNPINVFMLQEPTVTNQWHFDLTKHYFNFGGSDYYESGKMYEMEIPWNLNK